MNDAIAVKFAEFREKPVAFNRLVLNRPDYWSKQSMICESVRSNKGTVVATGNAIGKSFLAAGIILWYLFTRKDSLVVITAPSQTLLGTVLFKEIRGCYKSARKAGIILPGQVTESEKASPQFVLINETWKAIGFSTNSTQRLSGQHNKDHLIVVDESSGIDEKAWEALASQNAEKLVLFGNPLRYMDRFHKYFEQGVVEEQNPNPNDTSVFRSFRISSKESPDINEPRSSRGLADLGFLESAKKLWGIGTPLYDSHVEAIFPSSATYSLFPKDHVDYMFNSKYEPCDGGRVLSVDLSKGTGSDKTVLLVRSRNAIEDVYESKELSLMGAAVKVREMCLKHGIPYNRVVFDRSGIGIDFPNYLSGLGINGAIPYHGSFAGDHWQGQFFENARALYTWRLKARINTDISDIDNITYDWKGRPVLVPKKPFAISPLVSLDSRKDLYEEMCNMEYIPSNQRMAIQVEPKEALMKKINGRSPDILDALTMSFFLECKNEH